MKGYQQHIAAIQKDLRQSIIQHKKNIIENFSDQEFLAITNEITNIINLIEESKTLGVDGYEDLLRVCKTIRQAVNNNNKNQQLSDEWNNKMTQIHQENIIKIIHILENI
ncbi:MAG: hypothetical protein ACMXYD_01885 [Candidatus Woesearchaeota archaeon]